MNLGFVSGRPSREPAFQSVAEHMSGALLQYVLGPSGEQRIGWMSQGCRDIREVAPQVTEQDADVLWSMVDEHDGVVMRASLLGSAAVRALLQSQLRESMEVDCAPGKGTRFSFLFPAVVKRPRPMPLLQPARNAGHQGTSHSIEAPLRRARR